jgi:hypothetical protein
MRPHRRPYIQQASQRARQLDERDVEEIPYVIHQPLTDVKSDIRGRLRGIEGVSGNIEIGGVVFGEIEGS